MPRPVELRPNYMADIAYLTRLAKAIDLDKSQPSGQLREIQSYINNLIDSLNRANKNRMKADDE